MPRPFIPQLSPPAKRLIDMIDSGLYGSRIALAHSMGLTAHELDTVISGRAELTDTEVVVLAQIAGVSVAELQDLETPLPTGDHGVLILRRNLWDLRDRLTKFRGNSARLAPTFTLTNPIYGAPPSRLVQTYLTEIHTEGITPTPEFLEVVADILGVTPEALHKVTIHDLAPIRRLKAEATRVSAARKALRQAQRLYDARRNKYQRLLQEVPQEHQKFIGASAQIEDV